MGIPTIGNTFEIIPSSGNIHWYDIASLSDTKAIAVYEGIGSGIHIQATTLTLSGNTIVSSGVPISIVTQQSHYPRIKKLTADKAILTYTEDSVTDSQIAVCLTSSGDTTTKHTPITIDYDTGTKMRGGDIAVLGSGAAISFYLDIDTGGPSATWKAKYLNISDTTITLGSGVSIGDVGSNSLSQSSACTLSSGCVLFGTERSSTSYGYLSKVTASGNVLYSTPFQKVGTNYASSIDIGKISETKALIGYTDTSAASAEVRASTVDIQATGVYINPYYTIETTDDDYDAAVFIQMSGSSYGMIGYSYANSGTFVRELGIYGDEIAIGNPSDSYSSYAARTQSSKNDSEKPIIIFQDGSDFFDVTSAIATFSGTVPQLPVNPPLPDNAVFYSHLDGDISVNRHDITLINGAKIFANRGTFGGFLTFNGNYAQIPDSDDWSFGSGDFVIEIILKFATTTGTQTLISQWGDTTNNKSFITYLQSNIMHFLYSINGSTDTDVQFSWTPSIDTEYHIAFVRDGANLRFYVNGSQVGSTYNISTSLFYASSSNLNLASFNNGGGLWFNGGMSLIRIIKGNDNGWTGTTIAVPTETYSIDDNEDTVLLIQGNGDISEGQHDITTFGEPIIDSGGGTNINFNGAYELNGTTDYLTIADSDDWNMQADFSIGIKIKFDDLTSSHGIMGQWIDGSNHWQFNWEMFSNRGIAFYTYAGGSYGININQGNTSGWSTGVWYDILAVANGNTMTIYRDGTSVASGDITGASRPTYAANLIIGARADIDYYLDGVIDEILFVDGTAIQTGNFTPSPLPYSDQTVRKNLLFYLTGSEPVNTNLNNFVHGYDVNNSSLNDHIYGVGELEHRRGQNFDNVVTKAEFYKIYEGQYENIRTWKVYGNSYKSGLDYNIYFYADQDRIYEIGRYISTDSSGSDITVIGSGVGVGMSGVFDYAF